MIDIETCEYTRHYANYFDPYDTYPWDDDPRDDANKGVGTCTLVSVTFTPKISPAPSRRDHIARRLDRPEQQNAATRSEDKDRGAYRVAKIVKTADAKRIPTR